MESLCCLVKAMSRTPRPSLRKFTLPTQLALVQPWAGPSPHVVPCSFSGGGGSAVSGGVPCCRSVPPQGVVSADLTTIPVKAGDVELVVRFSSAQLSDITGDVDTKVLA